MSRFVIEEGRLGFIFPKDGDCVNANDGIVIDGGVRIAVSIQAPFGHDIELNGGFVRYENGCYRGYADIKNGENTLCARDVTTGDSASVKVYSLPNALGGYRLSSDDNIIFLYDINEHKDEYKSIFDNPYLAIYKKAHDLWGAKAHLNLFYEFDDEARACFSEDRPYFNLSMMTDKFKDEFRANADWLKFTFHAKSEFPPMPYKYADGETVRRDCEKIHSEIRRFAGDEVISRCTTVHFGEANRDGVRVLRELGYKVLTGYFIDGEFPVAYYADNEMINHVYERDFWRDNETDMLFGRIDLVLNLNKHSENMQILREIMASPTRGGFMSVMIHEQYFYSDYMNYLPDFESRVLDACELIAKSVYVGRHITEAAGF